ncbi:MAG: PAS domain S-box protein [Betaproteobacteria bacterium]
MTGPGLAEEALRDSEEKYRMLVDGIQDHAIFMLDPQGNVLSWNAGAERIKGYTAGQIIGRNFACFFPPEDVERGRPHEVLRMTAASGRHVEQGMRLRKDGSRFLADVTFTALRDPAGKLRGFSEFSHDISARKEAEAQLLQKVEELSRANRELGQFADGAAAANMELEAFAYSVSHDLRAPLRSLDGFSQVLLEDYGDKLDDEGRDSLNRIRAASQRMGLLIDDMLSLSQVTRREIVPARVDLSRMAVEIVAELRQREPQRQVEFIAAPGLIATTDPELMRIALVNLLGNAWKFTGGRAPARIEFGAAEEEGRRDYFVTDNGVGFDMAYAGKLFGAFQRMHSTAEFEGTGIGLATVQRVIHRLGGEVWAKAVPDHGATFNFRLMPEPAHDQ